MFYMSKAYKVIKGLVHPKMKISMWFTHFQAILGVYDFLLSDESIRGYITNCAAIPSVIIAVVGCFCSTVQNTSNKALVL